MQSLTSADIVLRLVGVFYAFAGIVGVRAALASHFIDTAIAALGGGRPSKAELGRSLWLLIGALLVLAGGAALMLLLDVSAWLFVASALGQALYLAVAAPYVFDPADPADNEGRGQTTNAFVLYLLATAFVVWAAYAGRLVPWQSVPWPLAHAATLAAGAYAAYAVIQFVRPFSDRG